MLPIGTRSNQTRVPGRNKSLPPQPTEMFFLAHVPMFRLPGHRRRTLQYGYTLSSFSLKDFSCHFVSSIEYTSTHSKVQTGRCKWLSGIGFWESKSQGSSLARACSLLLSTFALTFFLSLSQFGRRGNLFRRHDGSQTTSPAGVCQRGRKHAQFRAHTRRTASQTSPILPRTTDDNRSPMLKSTPVIVTTTTAGQYP